MKIKNKNLRKYKIKKFIFFKSKLEQEIKIRKNPEIQKIIQKIQKILPNILTKIYHFLIDFHSLTPAGVPFPLEQSLILLGRIHASGRLSNKELVHFHSQSTTKY